MKSMSGVCFLLGVLLLHAQVPQTRAEDFTETLHGLTISDPYRWLENGSAPETRTWIEAQMAYTRSMLDKLPERGPIHRRLEELMRVESTGVPMVRAGRYFYARRKPQEAQSVICMRRGLHGREEVLLDPNPLSPDQTTSAGISAVSEDGRLMAYAIREGGEDEVTLRVMDVNSRRDLPDGIDRTRLFGVSFTPDKSGYYYSKFTAAGSRVYYHAIGDASQNREIFGQGYGLAQIINASLSRDGRRLLFHVRHGSKKVEVYHQDLRRNTPAAPIVNDIEASFEGRLAGDTLFLLTNWKASKGRILAVDLNDPAREKWREIVPESKWAIDSFAAVGGKLFVTYLDNVTTRIRIFNPDGRHLRDIALPRLGAATGPSGRWEDDEAFYSFTSFTTPPRVYRYQVSSGKRELWARNRVPIDARNIQVEQVWYQSKDGTRVPMFVVSPKGRRRGVRPALLTGYGGFNTNMTASFSASAALWVEKGGVFALANLRGGSEFGENWHQAGMFEKKQNVFDDFIAAGEYLIDRGYTQPSRLAILGGSNGGLLVGAAMTQRPELFAAVICGAPLLDMLRYHKFLVAPFWVSEYGSADDPKQFEYLYRYSPYHNIKPGTKYPAVMFVTGDSDTRVDPLHARKMAARMQAATGSDRPVLLHYDTKAGHSGGLPVAKQIDDLTDEITFLRWQLGVAEQPDQSPAYSPRH